jgi:hypothetical protein
MSLFFALLFSFHLKAADFGEVEHFSDLGIQSIFNQTPLDDPALWNVADGEYKATLGPLFWLIPGPVKDLQEIVAQKSNNNVAIEFFENCFFVASRTGPTHFASKKTRMHVASTCDGVKWSYEWTFDGKRDAREPQLVSFNGKLRLYFFAGGTNPFKFSPAKVYMTERISQKLWSAPQEVLEPGDVHWEMKVRGGKLWTTTYHGSHYQLSGGPARVKVKLKVSEDGVHFENFRQNDQATYTGGASETGFEFDEAGNLWGITRNEDGDVSGFGSHLVWAAGDDIGLWNLTASPISYHSPRMLRHGRDIYLVARRDLGRAPYDWNQSSHWALRRILNWTRFSLTAKTTALFKINTAEKKIEHVMDLPGAGDTAFPSIRRVNEHRFLIANYTSPLKRRYRKWIVGQLARTQIYLIVLEFKKAN